MVLSNEANPGTTLQSIRSSCDRCRFHKLKCTVQPESGGPAPCERCTRAKVPCIFGRRRRANRSGDEKSRSEQAAQQQQQQQKQQQQQQQQQQTPVTATSSILTPQSTSVPSSAPSCNQSTGYDLQMAETSEGKQIYDIHSWESTINGGTDDSNSMPSGGMEWERLHHNFSPDEVYVFDTDSLDPTSWSPPVSFLPLLSLATDFQVAPGGSTKASNWAPVQQLHSLISEMQQCLEILERGPWQGDCTRGLDDYPVGTILHLSQGFVAIAGPVLGKASTTGMIRASITSRSQGLNADARGDVGSARSEVVAGGDNSAAALFVLGGYMWLVRIYSVVLDHFQSHLSHHSCTGNVTNRSASSSVSPTLQLGELPSASTSQELGRIHTAVSMLLRALHEVEEHSGQGGAVIRNLVVALLTLPRVNEFDDSSVLHEKMQSIKELLREKMGL